MGERYYWADVLNEFRNILVKVESGMKSKLRTDTGIWIEQFITAAPRPDDTGAASTEPAEGEVSPDAARAAAQAAFMRRYGLVMRGSGGMMANPNPQGGAGETSTAATPTPGTARKKKGDPNDVSSITVTFRAVSLNSVSSEANKEIVFSVLNEIKNSPLFDPDYTDPDGKGLSAEEAPGTFTFGFFVGLKRPLKL